MAQQRIHRFLEVAILACIALGGASAAAQVQRIGPLTIAGASDELKHAVEDKGYRVTLERLERRISGSPNSLRLRRKKSRARSIRN